MSKKIAVINDLSGFGRCSLTAAIPVISVMGVQPCPLPTAVLSAQTGYPSYFIDDFTGKMESFRKEWEKLNVSFEGIYTGFMASEKQIDHVFRFLDTFYKKDTFLLVDPIMGDDGVKFDMFTDGLLEKMKQLVKRADIITPNLTELCLLTGGDYDTIVKIPINLQVQLILQMADEFIGTSDKSVIVTGIRFMENEEKKIGNLVITKDNWEMISFPYMGGSFSGTGDLFASVIAGGMARGDKLTDLCRLAGKFIERSMKDSEEARVEEVSGTEFEKHLGMLIKK